jgi:hypothetical protein
MQLTIENEIGMRFLAYAVKVNLPPGEALDKLLETVEAFEVKEACERGYF